MRLMLHILRKDVRRLQWEIGVTLAALAALAHVEARRSSEFPGTLEGLLNVVLPGLWAYLMALLIHGEGPVGDRQFWITRPYPRWSLIASKALFALVFIHLASLAADMVLVTVRGFGAFESLAPLLEKQVRLALAVTIPAAGLAAVTRTLPQFVGAAVLIVVPFLWLTDVLEPAPPILALRDTMRRAIPAAFLAVAGCGVVIAQYWKRRAGVARTALAGAVALAIAAFLWLPNSWTFSIRCALFPQQASLDGLKIELWKEYSRPRHVNAFFLGATEPDTTVVAIPARLSGVTALDAPLHVAVLDLEVLGPGGEHWRVPQRSSPRQHLVRMDREAALQVFALDRKRFEGLRQLPVTVRGRACATLYGRKDTVRIPVSVTRVTAPGVGRCYSHLMGGSPSILKLVCESVAGLPTLTEARLVYKTTGDTWSQSFTGSSRSSSVLNPSWLSPFDRAEAVFYGSDWLISRGLLPQTSLELFASDVVACSVFEYELRNVKLGEFIVESGLRPPTNTR